MQIKKRNKAEDKPTQDKSKCREPYEDGILVNRSTSESPVASHSLRRVLLVPMVSVWTIHTHLFFIW